MGGWDFLDKPLIFVFLGILPPFGMYIWYFINFNFFKNIISFCHVYIILY